MERFSFSLQKVLEYRLQVEDQVKEKYAAVLRLEKEQRNEYDQLIGEKSGLMQTPQFSVGRMQVTRRYLQALSEHLLACQKNLLEIQQQKEQLRIELVEAQKQRKVIERLKEKQLTVYKKKEALEQQKQLDDFHRPVQFNG